MPNEKDVIDIQSKGHAKNTTVSLNGTPLKMVRGLEFRVDMDEFNETKLTLMSDATIHIEMSPDQVEQQVERIVAFMPVSPHPDDIVVTSFITVNGSTGVLSSVFTKEVYETMKHGIDKLLTQYFEKAISLCIKMEPMDYNKDKFARTYRISNDREDTVSYVSHGDNDRPDMPNIFLHKEGIDQ